MNYMKIKGYRPEPAVRNDTKGKWRHRVDVSSQRQIFTNMSWDTKEEAKDWVLWNDYDREIYGEIIENPEYDQ